MSQRRRGLGTFFLLSAGTLVVTVVSCLAYVNRDQWLVHYHVRQAVSDAAPETSLAWLTARPSLALPLLLSRLADPEPELCGRAGKAIERIVANNNDPTTPEQSHVSLALAAKIHDVFDQFSPAGKQQAVAVTKSILKAHLSQWSPNVPTALQTAGDVLHMTLCDTDVSVALSALKVLPEVWAWNGADAVNKTGVDAWKRRCYDDAVDRLSSENAIVRAESASALKGSPFHEGDPALISRLEDESEGVRHAVLKTLAASGADALDSEQKSLVMNYLHSKDPEVQKAAASVLRGAGLSDAVVKLATLVRHPAPAERAKVVSLAFSVPGIDPTRWVLELAHDPSPAVRLAVARAASSSPDPALKKALAEMAESDPDPNVREMSREFLIVSAKR